MINRSRSPGPKLTKLIQPWCSQITSEHSRSTKKRQKSNSEKYILSKMHSAPKASAPKHQTFCFECFVSFHLPPHSSLRRTAVLPSIVYSWKAPNIQRRRFLSTKCRTQCRNERSLFCRFGLGGLYMRAWFGFWCLQHFHFILCTFSHQKPECFVVVTVSECNLMTLMRDGGVRKLRHFGLSKKLA